MNNFKGQFTEEAFLFSTFVEKSRLVIESVNGFAFVNFLVTSWATQGPGPSSLSPDMQHFLGRSWQLQKTNLESQDSFLG